MAYDDAQARLEAESFGMTIVYMGMLKKGPAWTPDETPEVMALQQAHLANIRRMGELGKLSVAGPVLEGDPIRGFYVFTTDSLQEAEELARTDPSVRAGRLIIDMVPWMVMKGKF